MESLKFFEVKGKKIPYYYFVYDKELHVLLRRRNYFKALHTKLDDGRSLVEFLMDETFRQFNNEENFYVFERAFMLVVHYFKDHFIRDIDNYVYKPIVDCIKKTRIIKDDDYSNLAFSYVGQKDIKDCIEVYVIPFLYFGAFMRQAFYDFTDPYISETQIRTINDVEEEKRNQKQTLEERKKREEEIFNIPY